MTAILQSIIRKSRSIRIFKPGVRRGRYAGFLKLLLCECWYMCVCVCVCVHPWVVFGWYNINLFELDMATCMTQRKSDPDMRIEPTWFQPCPALSYSTHFMEPS